MRLAERVVVEKDGPGTDAERAGGRVMAEVREHIALLGQLADQRLQDPALVASRVGSKEDGAAFQEVDLARRVVREDVPPVVVGGSHRYPTQPGSLRDVVQHGVHALVHEIGGERECRGLDRWTLPSGRT